MLDIHPQPYNSHIEVHFSGRRVDVGHLDESSFIDDIHAARRVLASTVEQGLFLEEAQTEFEFLHRFDSVEEWTQYMETHEYGDPEADRPLIEATRALMLQEQGEIVMRELVRAARLRRPG